MLLTLCETALKSMFSNGLFLVELYRWVQVVTDPAQADFILAHGTQVCLSTQSIRQCK